MSALLSGPRKATGPRQGKAQPALPPRSPSQDSQGTTIWPLFPSMAGLTFPWKRIVVFLCGSGPAFEMLFISLYSPLIYSGAVFTFRLVMANVKVTVLSVFSCCSFFLPFRGIHGHEGHARFPHPAFMSSGSPGHRDHLTRGRQTPWSPRPFRQQLSFLNRENNGYAFSLLIITWSEINQAASGNAYCTCDGVWAAACPSPGTDTFLRDSILTPAFGSCSSPGS